MLTGFSQTGIAAYALIQINILSIDPKVCQILFDAPEFERNMTVPAIAGSTRNYLHETRDMLIIPSSQCDNITWELLNLTSATSNDLSPADGSLIGFDEGDANKIWVSANAPQFFFVFLRATSNSSSVPLMVRLGIKSGSNCQMFFKPLDYYIERSLNVSDATKPLTSLLR